MTIRDWVRKWHVIRINYYMSLYDSCLCPAERTVWLAKAELYIRKFEATFEA